MSALGGILTPEILVIDFGSQFTQLIARRFRELGVYSEIVSWRETEAPSFPVKGLVLSGSAHSVLDPEPPCLPDYAMKLNVPILGICYGMQLVCSTFGGAVKSCAKREYGYANVTVDDYNAVKASELFSHVLPPKQADGNEEKRCQPWEVWMSHGDAVSALPAGFKKLASTSTCPYVAVEDGARRIFLVQFHPELTHTLMGRKLLDGFASVCGCERGWRLLGDAVPHSAGHLTPTPDSVAVHETDPSCHKSPYLVDRLVEELRAQANLNGDTGGVLLGLSGGVDSSVAAALLCRAIGPARLHCVLVDHGLLRKDEAAKVKQAFATNYPELNVTVLDKSAEFMAALKGVEDPEVKRKIIGEQFVRCFELFAEEAMGSGRNITMLAQGTIYPDVIESAGVGNAKVIKSHHNVGGLPERMNLRLIEPLRRLFKDEVRRLGEALGLPHQFVWRHPFPGPGLGIRVLGCVDQEACDVLREADHIFTQELLSSDLYESTSQAFAALLPCKAVGVKGDGRVFEKIVSLRAVTTDDFMTAHVSPKITIDFLQHVARRILNEVAGVARVVFDLTDKPPGTIEYE